jgi:chemotaxis protein CheD
MSKTIDISTGEVKSAGANTILRSAAIGSCIVVTAYYPEQNIGSMAHIMLPGKATDKNEENKFRYAENAIIELLLQLDVPLNKIQDIKICLIGGGNVLKREDDTICEKNIESVLEILSQKQLKTEAKALGGTDRRTVQFDIAKGEVYFTEGNSKAMLLWKYNGNKSDL